MQAYDYPRKEQQFSFHLQESTQHWLCYGLSFLSALSNRYQKNNTAQGECYMPSTGERFPVAILLHGIGGLGERDVMPCKLLARDLAKRGVASFVLQLVLPGQGPAGAGKGQPSMPVIENWLELYQVLVINTRQVIDWAEDRNGLDAQRVAVIGISMGGMASAIAMAVDKRITAGVFLVTGGNMETLTWKSSNDIARMSHKCTETECHEVYSHYPQYLADVQEKGIENVVPAKDCFLYDPLSFASYLRGRQTLMINAERDDFVPRDCTLEFWEASGCPRLVWLPADHNTIFLRYHSIRKEITAFLGSALGMEPEARA